MNAAIARSLLRYLEQRTTDMVAMLERLVCIESRHCGRFAGCPVSPSWHPSWSGHAMNDPVAGISINVGMIEGGVRSHVVAPERSAVVEVRAANRSDAAEIARKVREIRPAALGR